MLIQFNRVFDTSRAEHAVLDHALQPRGDWELAAAELGLTREVVAAERGITWRSFLLSHKCSVYDATDDVATTEQNDVFPASGSEYLRQQCLLRRLGAPHDPRSDADDDDDDGGQSLDATSGSAHPLAFTL
jgi:hypothetical protein